MSDHTVDSVYSCFFIFRLPLLPPSLPPSGWMRLHCVFDLTLLTPTSSAPPAPNTHTLCCGTGLIPVNEAAAFFMQGSSRSRGPSVYVLRGECRLAPGERLLLRCELKVSTLSVLCHIGSRCPFATPASSLLYVHNYWKGAPIFFVCIHLELLWQPAVGARTTFCP